MTRSEFQEYWRDVHAPLVLSASEVLRIRSYEQLHSLPAVQSDMLRKTRGTAEDFDGIAMLGWRDLDDMAAPFQTEAGVAAAQRLLDDERRFIDHSRSSIWMTERVTIL